MNAFEEEFFKRVNPADADKCRSEMETAYIDGISAMAHIKSKDYLKLASDMMGLYSVFE